MRSALTPLISISLLSVFVARAWAAEEKAGDRAPVPERAAVAEAEKKIREIFKEDYAKASREDKAALANRLIQQAGDSKDDLAARYVLLREASTLAAQAGDPAIALNALTEMGKAYSVDAMALKLDALAKASSAAATPDAQKTLAEHYLVLMEEAAAADNYDAAMRAAVPAEAAARRGQDATLITRVQTRAKEVRDLQGESAKAKVAKQTLAQKPDDPVANLLVGRFLCFSKADWDSGLPLLAKCPLPTLKTLAAKDLAQPTEAVAQVEVGDGWWDMSEKETGKEAKAAFQARARFWYGKAQASLSGLTKTKVEKRLAAAPAGVVAGSGASSMADAGKTLSIHLGGGVKMELVLVPAGEFTMGDNSGGAEEKPAHKVKISKPYYIGKFHVTVAQFRAFADATKYVTEAEKSNRGWSVKDGTWQEMNGIAWRTPGFKQEDNHPVCVITWNDAQEFCRWVGKLTGRKVCLPTEAQWEYAARGPKSPKYPWGDKWDGTKANHADVTWRKSPAAVQDWGSSTDNDGFAWTAPVGSYKDNASWCGAYDMAGNVWERVEDFFNDNYYQESPAVDPKGPGTGGARVLRGGSWNHGPGGCRAANRHKHDPGSRDAGVGFRVALDF
ncbi:MAG: formylglycine-generating enzyme family protein [Planctomycetota bacterium]|nr:formylglycine-generating enzyme family protein [Planctomycetota bacterium]